MTTVLFDIETNGLLDRPDLAIHVVVTQEIETGKRLVWYQYDYGKMLGYLDTATRLVGHNITGFDLPVFKMVLGWEPHLSMELYDTLLASRLIYASNMFGHSIRIQRTMAKRFKLDPEEVFPRKLLGRHSLKSWGYRLGHLKGTHLEKTGADEHYSKELEEYCVNDVLLNIEVYENLLRTPANPGWPVCSIESILNESAYGALLSKQEANGVRFDEKAAGVLVGTLAERKVKLTAELQNMYEPFAMPDGKPFIPKQTRTMPPTKHWPHPKDYIKGEPFQKQKMVLFNPGSGLHISHVLQELGWMPKEFCDDGSACTDEKALVGLAYPGIEQMLEYMTVKKRLGQIVDGKKAWFKYVDHTGLIHGRVYATGTRTSRCAHFNPNLGQVPSVTSPYGAECRALFSPPTEGRVMVGIDASGLELRMLASRLAYYDDGAFWKVLSEGDPHTDWMRSTGIMIRNNQKTWTYACLYGAGDRKLGLIILDDWRQAFAQGLTKEKPKAQRWAKELGKASRGKLLGDNPALKLLLEATRAAKKSGYIIALDGRVLQCKTDHGSLNDLLQSDGAIVMKHAKVIFAGLLRYNGVEGKWDWMLDIHDEWQLETDPDVAEEIGKLGCRAIKMAGEALGVRVPLDGAYKVGATWRDTH